MTCGEVSRIQGFGKEVTGVELDELGKFMIKSWPVEKKIHMLNTTFN